MILIGQYDSPFVRRVAVALYLYVIPYEHRPWSVFGDPQRIAQFNPLRRVPTLVLDDGEVLIESTMILDWLDELAGPGAALIASDGPRRRHGLRTCALAMGLADKAISLVYERVVHDRGTPLWVERCRTQITGALDMLEQDRADSPGLWWQDDAIGHADIAVGCVLRFLSEAHPDAFDIRDWPALAAHSQACEALPAFQSAVQPFYVTPPA